jgi:glycosyltransferase involved in cell wall biosynthesis
MAPDPSLSSPPLSVCFVAHNAFGAMSGEQRGYIGGIEHQQSMMARWLARRGHDVSMITWDEGHEDGKALDSVRVFSACRRDAGLPGVRFFVPRWTSLVAAMRRANAAVYYQNTAEYVTGQVALWARRNGRGFVYSVASDPDCDPALPALGTLRERVLYRHGLRRADEVVVQTRRQQQMLRDGFARESTMIPMPCEGPDDATYAPPAAPLAGATRVAWIGRVAPVKRLELLLDVAALVPEIEFDVAGPWDQEGAYAATLRERAAAARNVTVVGRLRRDQLDGFYRGRQALCCTSEFEGFPNTFLEAWSHGLPIVSTVDPDGLIAARSLGEFATGAAPLAAALRRLVAAPAGWAQASQNARRYFVENHAFESVMPRFEQVFREATPQKHGQP